MPTEYLHRLQVEGAAAAPWQSIYGLRVVEDLEGGSLTYRYEDDYKRPAPSAADVAAAHPGLSFSHEFTDEFGQVAGRQRYSGGVCVEDVRLEPEELDWIAWDDGE